MITSGQQKEQGVEVGDWSQWVRVGWTKFEIGGRQYRRVFIK